MNVWVLPGPLILQTSPSGAASAINLAMSMEIINKSTPNQERKYRLSSAGWTAKQTTCRCPMFLSGSTTLNPSRDVEIGGSPEFPRIVSSSTCWNLPSFVHSFINIHYIWVFNIYTTRTLNPEIDNMLVVPSPHGIFESTSPFLRKTRVRTPATANNNTENWKTTPDLHA